MRIKLFKWIIAIHLNPSHKSNDCNRIKRDLCHVSTNDLSGESGNMYLLAMPNGQIIPGQLDMVINAPLNGRLTASVTVLIKGFKKDLEY